MDPTTVHQNIARAIRQRRWAEAEHWLRVMADHLARGGELPEAVSKDRQQYLGKINKLSHRAARRSRGWRKSASTVQGFWTQFQGEK